MLAQDNNTSNVAYQDEHTRFTIISDGTIRMEWQKDGKFVNSPSFVAVERSYAPAEFQVHDSDGLIQKISLHPSTGNRVIPMPEI